MTQDFDIIIAGGGLNGPALGLALVAAGFRVAIVDQRPADLRQQRDFDGRAYALALASQRLLKGIGVWGAVAAHVQPIQGIRTSDQVPKEGQLPFFLGFDQAELDEGPMGYLLEDRYLYTAFLQAMSQAKGLTLISERAVVAQEISPTGVTVQLSDGASLTAKLLIGCDGRKSGVALRAKIRRVGWGYGQTALVNALQLEAPHGGLAHQVFLPAGPLAILPLPQDRVSIVWSEAEGNGRTLAALPDADYLEHLMARIEHITGPAQLVGTRFSYPLSLSLAENYVAPRVALVGDAAHGVHPIAGQGLNLGLRDVAALAEVLVEAERRGEDIGAINVLERYQTWRRFDATVLALGMDSVNRVFSTANPLMRLARGVGMRAISALEGPRRRFIREAAGVEGDLPRLLRGMPL